MVAILVMVYLMELKHGTVLVITCMSAWYKTRNQACDNSPVEKSISMLHQYNISKKQLSFNSSLYNRPFKKINGIPPDVHNTYERKNFIQCTAAAYISIRSRR